jgi:hypothetical protein
MMAGHLLSHVESQSDYTIQAEAIMPEYKNLLGSDSDASFIGWQETLSGKFYPLFNITIADHPLYRSTVSDDTLRRLRLRVPDILSSFNRIDLISK